MVSPVVMLIGPPGSGKTEVGHALAGDLGWTFVDTDVFIEQAAGLTVPNIFTQCGEGVFRLLEKKLVEKIGQLYSQSLQVQEAPVLIKEDGDIPKSALGTVISTGGGLPVLPENLAILSKIGKLVTLYASVEVLAERTAKKANRPLLNPAGVIGHEKEQQARLQSLLEERKHIYAKGSLCIDTSHLTIASVADLIIKELELGVTA
jgi:shikimate kinase